MLFECRSYRSTIRQQALHAWRSVIDDVRVSGWETLGVMVTTTGYQSGATRVADTYGITIYELRAPTHDDKMGRAQRIDVTIQARMPICRVEGFDVERAHRDVSGLVDPNSMTIDTPEGPRPLVEWLLDGEGRQPSWPERRPSWPGLSSFDEPPRVARRVRKAVSQSAVVHFEGTPLMTVNAVEATVGEDDLEPMVVAVDAAVSWMLRNALTGGRLWFSAGGEIHETET